MTTRCIAQGHRYPAGADDPPYPAGRGFPGGAHGVLPVLPRDAHRLVRSEQTFRTLTLDGEALYAERLYTVAVQKYHYNNLKPFLDITLEEVEKNGKIRVLSTSARDVVEEYLTVNQHLSREVEGRLVVED